ncbi:hypothetical protein CHARACLAT_030855 [Characodon lateralis]|uniref:Uncharacterized protein n=1 Tax=Characodon lateralis TaxID=208331 RepID=A0ABU7F8F5_9TELE|nr:hypothetical protein [Characodon lateralis]
MRRVVTLQHSAAKSSKGEVASALRGHSSPRQTDARDPHRVAIRLTQWQFTVKHSGCTRQTKEAHPNHPILATSSLEHTNLAAGHLNSLQPQNCPAMRRNPLQTWWVWGACGGIHFGRINFGSLITKQYIKNDYAFNHTGADR